MQREVSKINSSSTFFLRGLPATITSMSIGMTSMQSSGHASAQRLQAMHRDSCVSGSMLRGGAPCQRGATCGRTDRYCAVYTPYPLTAFLSASAPRLIFSVSHIPLNMSARKKRRSLSLQHGRGTFTNDLEPLKHCLSPPSRAERPQAFPSARQRDESRGAAS